MNEKRLYNLIIDRDFVKTTPRMGEKEYKELERKIRFEAYQEPILTWKKAIIEGFCRYEIYHKYSIPFTIYELEFFSRNEAISYICQHSLKQKGLVDEQFRYCIGRLYDAQKKLLLEKYPIQNQYTPAELRRPPNISSRHLTAALIAEDYPLSPGSVYKYSTYAAAVDEIDRKSSVIADEILNGEFHISHTNTMELCKLSAEEIIVIHKHFKSGKGDKLLHSHMRRRLQQDKERKKKENQNRQRPEIKQMPKYDPDAEISSLTLTIPMWISSLKRTQSMAKFSEASTGALYKLDNQLQSLKDSIEEIQKIIQEEYHA